MLENRYSRSLISLAVVGIIALVIAATGLANTVGNQSVIATTGDTDPSAIVPENACASAQPGQVSCLAQILVNKNTGAVIHPDLSRPGSFNPAYRAQAAVVSPAGAAVAPPNPGTPAYLQQAYDLTGLSGIAGTGDTIAIIDAFGDSTAESDLATYRSAYHLPVCSVANTCFKVVNEAGQTGSLPGDDQGWDTEISLDLDAASALCPNCHIDLVEASSDELSDLIIAEQEAHALGANQLSNSWGVAASGSPLSNGFNNSQFSFSNQATLVASGDNGFLGPSQYDYPAALPGVTSVGGTSLFVPATTGSPSSRGFTEKVWGGSENEGTGSGCDTAVAQPAWQSAITGCNGRAYNDISADADPDTGMNIYDSSDGGWEVVGGTSEATPLTAAYYALVGNGTADGNASWDYTSSSLLNDVTQGSNSSLSGSCNTFICNAGPGFDGVSGNGSISGDVIAGPPGVSGPTQTSGSYVANQTTTSVTLNGGVYPNQVDTRYYWQYGTTTAYGQQTPAIDVGDGDTALSGSGGLIPVSSTITDLTPATYHYRLVATNNYDGSATTTYGYDYTISVAGSGTTSITTPVIANPAATSITTNSATLAASLNPEGETTTDYWQWGTTPAYGNTTILDNAGSGTSTVSIGSVLSELAPGTTYHFQLVAVNTQGQTVTSGDESFTTPVPTTPVLPGQNNPGQSNNGGSHTGTVTPPTQTPTKPIVTTTVNCSTASHCVLRVIIKLTKNVRYHGRIVKAGVIFNKVIMVPRNEHTQVKLNINSFGQSVLKQQHKLTATLFIAKQRIKVIVSQKTLLLTVSVGKS